MVTTLAWIVMVLLALAIITLAFLLAAWEPPRRLTLGLFNIPQPLPRPIGPDPLEVSLVEYLAADLIPVFLKPVAFITGIAPDSVARVSETWFASKDAAPAGRTCWGAVKYASYDLVPPFLKVYNSSGGPYIIAPPVPITDGTHLRFNDKTNSMHLATAGV